MAENPAGIILSVVCITFGGLLMLLAYRGDRYLSGLGAAVLVVGLICIARIAS